MRFVQGVPGEPEKRNACLPWGFQVSASYAKRRVDSQELQKSEFCQELLGVSTRLGSWLGIPRVKEEFGNALFEECN